MPFKKGQKKTGGRKKGGQNKISKNIKENFDAVFDKLGGIEGFHEWAKKNAHTQAAFYQMYSKMLPSNVDVDFGGEVKAKLEIIYTDKRPKE